MFHVEIVTEGEAFGNSDAEREEIIRLLEKVAQDLREGYDSSSLNDINGNYIGDWYLTD